MSILINGMEMPKHPTAIRIQIEADGSVYQNSDKTGNGWALQKNVTATEVPTPHGRLIDADAYHKEIRERYQSAKEWYNEAEDDEIIGRAEATMITFTECSLTLRKMPTIIEAEGE